MSDDTYRVVSNGAVIDTSTNRIVANPGGGTKAITAANSSAYHVKRQQVALAGQRAARRGLAAWSGRSALDGWAQIVEHQSGRAAIDVDSARFVGKATGFMADLGPIGADSGSNGGVSINLGADVLGQLLTFLANRSNNSP